MHFDDALLENILRKSKLVISYKNLYRYRCGRIGIRYITYECKPNPSSKQNQLVLL